MNAHFDKIDEYFREQDFLFQCYEQKYMQIIYQTILIGVIGTIAIEEKGDCSAPIQIFLEGLFGILVAGLVLNLFVGMIRICRRHVLVAESYKKSAEKISQRFDVCYLPLYWCFSIAEFAWYILGTIWYAQENDCSDEYPDGNNLALGLIVLYYVLLALAMCCCVGFNCYVATNQFPQQRDRPKPPDQTHQPNDLPPQEMQNYNQPGYDDRDPRYGGPGYHDPRYDSPRFQDPRYDDPRYQDPRYDDPRYQDPRYDDPRYQDPRYDDPRYQDPRYDDPRYQDPRYDDPRYQDPRYDDPRHQDPRYDDPRYQDPRYDDPRYQDPRYQDPGYENPRPYDDPYYK